MEVCKICNREFKSIQSLAKHVKRMHSLSSEDYYLKYLGVRGRCTCGQPTKYRNMADGYSSHCSAKCSYHDPDVTKKRQGSIHKKYGVNQVGNSPDVREKIKDTLKKKYGSDSTFHSEIIRDRIKERLMVRYGVKNIMELEEIRKKRERTMHQRYGVRHATQNIDIQEKTKATNLDRYGVEYVSQIKEVQDKIKATNLDRYGESVAIKSPEVLARRNNTNIERYGHITPLKHPAIKAKTVKTCQTKYGVHHPGASIEAHSKRKQSTLLKYGVECNFQVPEIQKRIKQTIFDKYGVENIHQLDKIKQQVKTNVNKNTLMAHSKQFTDHGCDLIGYSDSEFTYKCNVCNTVCSEPYQFVRVCRFDLNVSPCTHCFPKQSRISFAEVDVLNYIKSIYDRRVITNTTDIIPPKELDIYLPDNNIAIEYNGIFYHSEIYKNSDYHAVKTDVCNAKGIHLIHIYEDDWLYKNNIVKSRLNNLLGKSERIYARKCIIKLVESKSANKFLVDNHIQGKCRSKYKYGLYYDNELVSLMTFGKSRFSDEYELIRFCNKLNTVVIGGASKLFKYFTRTHDIDSIVSYADRSWSIGGLYEQLGFTFDSITKPGYSYVKKNIRENRMNYQKHKLIAAGYNENMTEHEIMLSRKMYRIYDSGHLKYVWNR